MIAILPFEQLSSTITCAHEFFLESQLPGKLDFEYWMERWKVLYANDLGCVFAFKVQGEVRGILGGLFVRCMMTGEMEAIEAFWYVQKDSRGKLGGIALIKAFEKEAIRRGCKRVKMVHLMSVNPEMMADLYRRMDYQELQRGYSKELQ